MNTVLDRIEKLLIIDHYFGLNAEQVAEIEALYALKSVMMAVQNGWRPK